MAFGGCEGGMWCTKDHGPTNSKRRRHGKSMKHLSIWRKQAYLGQAQAALQSGLAVSLPQLSCRLAALQTAAQSSGARELRGCNACVGAQPYAAHRAACRQRACNAVHTSPHHTTAQQQPRKPHLGSESSCLCHGRASRGAQRGGGLLSPVRQPGGLQHRLGYGHITPVLG